MKKKIFGLIALLGGLFCARPYVVSMGGKEQLDPALQKLTAPGHGMLPIREAISAKCSELTEPFKQLIYNKMGRVLQHDSAVLSVAFSPDGSKVATASSNSMVTVWNAENGERILTKEVQGLGDFVMFKSDTVLHVNRINAPALLLNVQTGQTLGTEENGMHGVHTICILSGRLYVECGYDENTAIIWDADDNPVYVLYHEGIVDRCNKSPNGSKIVTGSRDGTARIWDLDQLEQVHTFLNLPNIDQCELLRAIQMVVMREKTLGVMSEEQRGNREMIVPIQATDEQWHTFKTFPESVQDALLQYIKKTTLDLLPQGEFPLPDWQIKQMKEHGKRKRERENDSKKQPAVKRRRKG